jgi:hypothetical protein
MEFTTTTGKKKKTTKMIMLTHSRTLLMVRNKMNLTLMGTRSRKKRRVRQ